MTIRILSGKAPSDDWVLYRGIRLEALRGEPRHYASDLAAIEAYAEHEWRAVLAGTTMFGAFDRSALVAITALTQKPQPKMIHRAEIGQVYTRPEYRRDGVAARLLAAAREYARKAGVRQLELTVSGSNPKALRAYESAGFEVFGRLPAGYIHEDEEIEDVLMMQRI